MLKVVQRERNKTDYRVPHIPIRAWVFFVLSGHLTSDPFTSEPDRCNAVWPGVVAASRPAGRLAAPAAETPRG